MMIPAMQQQRQQQRCHYWMISLLFLFLALQHSLVHGFVVDSSSSTSRRLTTLTVRTPRGDGSYATTHLFMFDNSEKGPAPLEAVDATPAVSSSSTTTPGNVVKDLNTGEIKQVKWIDPAMAANENPFNMGWWAYALFVIMPAALLFNDLAKATGSAGFLPTDGPLGFFGRL